MKNKVTIYGLFNPINAECFYIGKTIVSLQERLNRHINDKKTNTNKQHIINSIISVGLKPVIAELITVDDYYINRFNCNYWELVEQYYIKYTRDVLKERIVNIDVGGFGGNDLYGKHILQYDLNGKFIKEYNSIKDVLRCNNITFNSKKELNKALRHKYKSYKGYQYRYADDTTPVYTNLIKKNITNTSKHILQYDLNNVLINEYKSLHDAATAIGKPNGQGNISRSCKNNNVCAYGFMWKSIS